jgi:hypothetical protein
MPDHILGRKLSSCFTDPTLRELYRQLVDLARQRRPVRFSYRCDAPAFRRLFEMRIQGGDQGGVEFASTPKWQEPRTAVPLLDCHQVRNRKLVRACSWCQRIATAGQWLPVEAAVEALGLMESATLPALTHGICEECHAGMLTVIAKRQGIAENKGSG